ncbi:hypothetical protein [Streptomyces galbus]|uniref:Uncharacterized protein n=1 Tax=Streptomyces galbus TaxID=33898 RepID=A0ABX1IG56_STRGB|nr:hypothetical protein [Streptomyces galbus]NKQ23207.1 hypothetical protein [Streptomyces galbus]
MSDLDRICDPVCAATDLFPDRGSEHSAFAAAFDGNTTISPLARLGNRQRANVLTYYGSGDIGKASVYAAH